MTRVKDKKIKFLHMRCFASEKTAIIKAAKAAGLTISAYVLTCVAAMDSK